jgi:retinol dehydrogenase-12
MRDPMQDKTCLVTGATRGIGFAAALQLARLGPRLLIVGRDPRRTRDAVEDIKRSTGNLRVEGLLADLSSQAQVRALARTVMHTAPRLNVLVNNAGALFRQRHLTEDGFERTWALNHLAGVTLTLALLDLLKAGGPARIVNVASALHHRGEIDFDDLQGERRYGAFTAYAQASLATVLFTRALARRLHGSGVVANSLHPGVVATGFGLHDHGFLRFAARLAQPFMLTPEQGAAGLVRLVQEPALDGVNGRYFVKGRPGEPSLRSHDLAMQDRLWELGLEQSGLLVAA